MSIVFATSDEDELLLPSGGFAGLLREKKRFLHVRHLGGAVLLVKYYAEDSWLRCEEEHARACLFQKPPAKCRMSWGEPAGGFLRREDVRPDTVE